MLFRSPAANVTVDDRDLVNLKRTTPSIPFPTGNWLFTRSGDVGVNSYPIPFANSGGYADITLTVTGNIIQNFSSLCYGDVDASYTGLKDNENTVVNFTTSNGLDLSNYPNPFTGRTTIQFAVPVSGSVTVEVRTLLGIPVATITDPDDYEGIHTLFFDQHGLAPGIYLYTVKLRTSDAVIEQTGKMMIIK